MESQPQLRMVFIYGAACRHWMKEEFEIRKKHVFVASGLVIMLTYLLW